MWVVAVLVYFSSPKELFFCWMLDRIGCSRLRITWVSPLLSA